MSAKIPNLELLQYKATIILSKKGLHKKNSEYDIECFPQIWGSTSTGFDVTETGDPTFGGSAMTKAYTTVVHNLTTEAYVVFFGDRSCYMVTDATEEFLEDLKNRNLKSLSEARTKY